MKTYIPLFLPAVLAALDVDPAMAQQVIGKAQDGQQAWREPPQIEVPAPQATGEIEHLPFEPYPVSEGEFADAAVFEQFIGSPEEIFKRWKPSHAKKAVDETADKKEKDEEVEWAYVGEWAIEEPTVFRGFDGDQGLVLKSPAAHHAISYKFDEALDNTGKTLVVQYEVKAQQPLLCGGAYIKLLADSEKLHNDEFSNDTPYVIMFGPDKCGATDKVHFILKRHGGEEHHLALPPRTKGGLLSTLYTLILHEDQRYEIRINGLVAKAGVLTSQDTFRPNLDPPKEIDDPHDSKPSDWVDDEYIPDPDQAVKPDDWDESAPMKIPDPDASIPDGWLSDVSPYIPDPEAEKPEEWDDEEDGEWIAPVVANPECESAAGCGKWKAPLIRNPAYKGKWSQPLVANPEYKGEWKPAKIPNPDYVEDARPSDLDPIGGLGLELWTMQADILFDNVYVGHSVIEAENIGNATWNPKYYHEVKAQSAARPEEDKPVGSWKQEWELFRGQPIAYTLFYYNQFVNDFSHDKLYAVQEHPLATSLFAVGFVLISGLLFSIVNVLLVTLTGRELPPIEKKKKEQNGRKAAVSASEATAADVDVVDVDAAEGTTSSAAVNGRKLRSRKD